MIRIGALILLWVGAAAQAQELDVPDAARQTATRSSALDSYAVPIDAFTQGSVPVYIMEGPVVREAWRLDGVSATTLQLLAPLRAQLIDTGYTIQLDCDDTACGGFDFRFGVEVLPAPNMVVNLRDYHFVTALRGPKGAPVSAITALVTRTDTAAFIQVIRVGQPKPASAKAASIDTSGVVVEAPITTDDLGRSLTTSGHVILFDLTFQTGSSRLGEGPFETLAQLAGFLKNNPKAQVALVGHTDAVGSLSGNIALSKARAQSVAQLLVERYDVPRGQIEAEGMGYLAPIASNLLPSGREANRRVEVVLLSMGEDNP